MYHQRFNVSRDYIWVANENGKLGEKESIVMSISISVTRSLPEWIACRNSKSQVIYKMYW